VRLDHVEYIEPYPKSRAVTMFPKDSEKGLVRARAWRRGAKWRSSTTRPDARRADIGAALELARRQGANLFELHTALDDFELRGQPARAALIEAASRMPTNDAWPELAQANLSEHSPQI
jgi:hypothetical protein